MIDPAFVPIARERSLLALISVLERRVEVVEAEAVEQTEQTEKWKAFVHNVLDLSEKREAHWQRKEKEWVRRGTRQEKRIHHLERVLDEDDEMLEGVYVDTDEEADAAELEGRKRAEAFDWDSIAVPSGSSSSSGGKAAVAKRMPAADKRLCDDGGGGAAKRRR